MRLEFPTRDQFLFSFSAFSIDPTADRRQPVKIPKVSDCIVSCRIVSIKPNRQAKQNNLSTEECPVAKPKSQLNRIDQCVLAIVLNSRSLEEWFIYLSIQPLQDSSCDAKKEARSIRYVRAGLSGVLPYCLVASAHILTTARCVWDVPFIVIHYTISSQD